MAAGECRHLDFLYRYWRIPQDPTGRLPGTGMLRSRSGVVRTVRSHLKECHLWLCRR
jgi:hypothetical protein